MVICNKLSARLGALILAFCIALGALGAHGLKPVLSAEQLSSFQTGIHYGQLHGLALLILALYNQQFASRKLVYAFFIGILFFTGSILFLSTQTLHHLPVAWLGPVTPLGGIILIGSWVIFFVRLIKIPQ